MKRPCSRSLGTELGWITAHTNSSTALLPYSESGKFIPSKGMVCVGCRGRGYLPCPHCKGSGVGPYHFGFFVIPKFCGLCGVVGSLLCPGCDGTGYYVVRTPDSSFLRDLLIKIGLLDEEKERQKFLPTLENLKKLGWR
ncbi:hypothetical protein GAYE_PCTG44G1117 [Galdieria yellowstonensis]|jgi:hypothetical protein|uniref:BSD2 cysteine rich domain-containing protein n=1 Tax=Galdieria yellowstonensis TaxID=3028027 RepID=A0AAV9I4B7_9RHOD|nr:hypothetical protein GAYE_PCTG44G1117 [Galdieria yellowstonensis]